MRINLREKIIFPKMVGRDESEPHRVVTNTELLVDLIYVVAIGVASENFFHLISERLFLKGSLGFLIVMFAICWSWINFLWFFSAFDTDDWFTRIGAMIQVAGIIILTTGISPVFAGLRHWYFNNTQVVIGYVIMRVSLVTLWGKVAVDSKKYRIIAIRNAVSFLMVQIAWVLTLIYLPYNMLVGLGIVSMEVLIPVIALYRQPQLPAHLSHAMERFSLLILITLGEVIVGSEESFGAVYAALGWSVTSVLVIVFGVALVFSIWRIYFSVPFVKYLQMVTNRNVGRIMLTYIHLIMFSCIAILGTALKLIIYLLLKQSALNTVETLLVLLIPVNIFVYIVGGFNKKTARFTKQSEELLINFTYPLVSVVVLSLALIDVNPTILVILLTLAGLLIALVPISADTDRAD